MPATAAVAVAARSCGRQNAGNAPADSRKIRPLAGWPAAMPLPHRARATPAAPALPPANPPQTPDPNTKLPEPAAVCPTKNFRTPTPFGRMPLPALRHAAETPANPSSRMTPADKDKSTTFIAGVPCPRFPVNASLSPPSSELGLRPPAAWLPLPCCYRYRCADRIGYRQKSDRGRLPYHRPHRQKTRRRRASRRSNLLPLPLAGRAGPKDPISFHREIPPGAPRRFLSTASAPPSLGDPVVDRRRSDARSGKILVMGPGEL